MSKVITLTKENFKEEVIESDLAVLVDFWAPWCGPCRMMAPILDELSEELEGKLKIAKLDVEDQANQELASRYDIQSIPNMKLFQAGKITKEFVGYRDKVSFQRELKEIIKF